MSQIKIILGIFATLLLIPLTANSEAELQDLVVHANMQNSLLYSGDRPIVSGFVTDHAFHSIGDAKVTIRSGIMTITTTTSEQGKFLVNLGQHDRLPGIYTVNILANTIDGKKGSTSVQFQIKGELSPTSVNEKKLSSPEAQKYLSANPDDFDKNPVGFMLYNYYQKLYQEYLEEQKITEQLKTEQVYVNQQKEIADKLRQEKIEETNPGYGIFSGYQYEKYIDGLATEVKPTVVEHLNFTKNLFEEAQLLRAEILENGGTAEEAHAAYLEKLTINRSIIENFDSYQNDQLIENPYPVLQNNTSPNLSVNENQSGKESSDDSSTSVYVNGIKIEVDYNDSIFYVNVNGTLLEFLVNGTEISLVNNSK